MMKNYNCLQMPLIYVLSENSRHKIILYCKQKKFYKVYSKLLTQIEYSRQLIILQPMDQKHQQEKPDNLYASKSQIDCSTKSPELLEEYTQFFGDRTELPSKPDVLAMLSRRMGVQYDEFGGTVPFSLSVLAHNSDFEVLECRVRIAFLTVAVTIFSRRGISRTHNLRDISTTGISVFAATFRGRDFVVKCIPLPELDFEDAFRRGVTEYCLLRVASDLHVGPAVGGIFGFDLLLSDGCLEFTMERCYPVGQWNEAEGLALQKKLWAFHLLRVVHVDIKPQNIMFSPSLGEHVFIDFGLSRLVLSRPGEKTMTEFAGTLGFCSPQMLRCYYQPNSSVDLFYNDVHCLKITLNELENRANKDEQQLGQSQMKQLDLVHAIGQDLKTEWWIIKLKSQLYLSLEQKFNDIAFIIQNAKVFEKFIKTLPFSWVYERFMFYQLIPQTNIKKQKHFGLSAHRDYYRGANRYKNTQNSHLQGNFQLQAIVRGINVGDCGNQADQYINTNNAKALLLSVSFTRAIQREQHRDLFLQFVDVCRAHSTAQEKLAAAKVLIQVEGWEEIEKGTSKRKQSTKSLAVRLRYNFKGELDHKVQEMISNPVQQCLQRLLQLWLQSDNPSFLQRVPIVLTNLIIHETLSEEELITVFQRVCYLRLEVISQIRLLFGCFVALEWIIHRAISRYKFTHVVAQSQHLLLQRLHAIGQQLWEAKERVSQKNKNQLQKEGDFFTLVVAMERLLRHDYFHEETKDFLQRSIGDVGGGLVQGFRYELLLYERLKKLWEKRHSGDLNEVTGHIEVVRAYLRKLGIQEAVGYSTLRLLTFACQMNVEPIAIGAYAALCRQLTASSIEVEKFRFHYCFQLNLYCNKEISEQAIIKVFLEHSHRECFIHDEVIMEKLSILITSFAFQSKNGMEKIKIFEGIFQNISISMFKQPFLGQCNIFEYNLLSYCKLHFWLFRSMEYVANGKVIVLLRPALQTLTALVNEVECKECFGECRKYIGLLEAHELFMKNQFQESIQAYISILNTIFSRKDHPEIAKLSQRHLVSFTKKQTCNLQNGLIHSIILQVLKISSAIFKVYENEESDDFIQTVDNYFQNYDLFQATFLPHLNIDIFVTYCQYALQIQQNVFRLYVLFLETIPHFSFFHSSKVQKIINYTTIWVANQHPKEIGWFNEGAESQMLTQIPEKHFEHKHLSLLFSACLRLQLRRKPFTALLRFVCEDVRLAHHDVRAMVIGNILYYKLRQLSLHHFTGDEEALRRRKRLRAALFRLYFKVDLFRLTFVEFLGGLGLKGEGNGREEARRLRAKALTSFRHLRDGNQALIASLGRLYVYQSPLQ